MRHFKTFDDHDLDVLFLQLNEGHIDTFVDAVVSKIKSCANLDEATSLARRVLLKAYELKKSVVPALLSSILLFMPVNQILSGSKDMKADAKEFFEKIIKQRTEKKSKELFDARISHLAPDFYEKMSMRESSNDWTISNGLGYIGAYQIGALAMLQMYDKVKLPFLKKLKGNRRERVNQLIAKFDSISKNKSLTSKQ